MAPQMLGDFASSFGICERQKGDSEGRAYGEGWAEVAQELVHR